MQINFHSLIGTKDTKRIWSVSLSMYSSWKNPIKKELPEKYVLIFPTSN